MNHSQPVVIRKHGFFTSLVRGVFATLIVAIICGSALGLSGMYIAATKAGQLLATAAEALPRWRESLPPAVVEALDDHRALDYADRLEVSAEFLPPPSDHRWGQLIITVRNGGDELVSLLGLRVTLEHDRQPARRGMAIYAATPFLIDDDWPGPLRPGQTRRIVRSVRQNHDELIPRTEIVEVRVWNNADKTRLAEPATRPALSLEPR